MNRKLKIDYFGHKNKIDHVFKNNGLRWMGESQLQCYGLLSAIYFCVNSICCFLFLYDTLLLQTLVILSYPAVVTEWLENFRRQQSCSDPGLNPA